MGKVKNLCLKKGLAIISTAFIAFTGTGCSIGGKKNDDGKNNSIVSIDEQTETVLSTIETTTTLKPFDKNSISIDHFDDGTSVVSDYVQTSYESDLTVSDITSTTAKSTDIIAEANKNDNPAKTSKSTIVKPTTTNVRITDGTTKIVNTTKTATPKPTTTVTTTTTEAVTEAPVQQEYNINDICYNADAFRYFSDKLVNELKTDSNGVYYDLINLNGNYTDMCVQGCSLLALLNYGAISDEVIASVFSEFNVDQISSCVDFLILIGDVNFNLNKKINYENYSCDSCKDIAQYANVIEDNYFNNNMEEFISYEIDAGNIEQRYRDSLAIKCLLGGYGNGYLFSLEFDDCMYDFSDYLSSVALGKSLKY